MNQLVGVDCRLLMARVILMAVCHSPELLHQGTILVQNHI